MADDGVEVLELRAPVERSANAIDIGHQRGRIARSPSANLYDKIASADPPHRVDHLEHRRSATVAAVEGGALAAAAQIAKRGRMRPREVADVDIVADAGAVGCRIVGAEDVDPGPLAERGLAGDLDQMGRGWARLSGAQLRIGAGDIEVAQDH